jgi:hypothetical protein
MLRLTLPLLLYACLGADPKTVDNAPDSAPTDSEVIDALAEDTLDPFDLRNGDTDEADARGPDLSPYPIGQWTFVEPPDMRCGNGSPTGFGINRGTRDDALFFILQGGGACWDVPTCFVVQAAANLESGYGAAKFDEERPGLEASLLLNRNVTENPFRDATFVYIPYCTGDMHSGTRIKRYAAALTRDVHHVGALNLDAVLAWTTARFPRATALWLYGLSAGGYGVVFNWTRFMRAFPDARVDALSDCGVPVTPPDGRYGLWLDAWGTTLPSPCDGCDTTLENVLLSQLERTPRGRFAQLAYTRDRVLSAYYGLAQPAMSPLIEALTRSLAPFPNASAFVLDGEDHVMVGNIATLAAADGAPLIPWLIAWATTASPWQSHTPW